MIVENNTQIKDPKRRLTNVWLFITLSALFLLLPLTEAYALTRLFTDCLFTLIIILSILGQTSLRKPFQLSYAFIGLFAVISTWIPIETKGFNILNAAMFIAFFLLSVFLFCHRLFTDEEVDMDTLLGAACTYILLGLFFASIYLLIYSVNPESFAIQGHAEYPESHKPPVIPLIYFSFVTLTTLGYGDVLPLTESARLISVYEAVIGQIFATVVVALLVGNYVARRY